MSQKILILDTAIHVPCERCRQFHRHFSHKNSIIHSVTAIPSFDSAEYSHMIITGSEDGADVQGEVLESLLHLVITAQSNGIPVLGVCSGSWSILYAATRPILVTQTNPKKRYSTLEPTNTSRLFNNLPDILFTKEKVTITPKQLPNSLRPTAHIAGKTVAFEHRSHPSFGLLIHPESLSHKKHRVKKPTPELSEQLFSNFYYSGADFSRV